ncbi:MAG: AbrB/MazE/SpoVT family DNA-binding domain-containing protein [Chloroflexi bacterium]|nr:AbrB/MazE/SpoVT family DNA-binding domain-containing protein [Chloroflexota bacterium]
MPTTVLSDKGQVVIPAKIRTQLGLQRGDRFEVEASEEGVVLRLVPRSPLLALRGAFKGPDSLTDVLLHEHRAERQREDA